MTAHLTPDELARWRDAGSASDRDRVVSHLAACDDCGAVYTELLEGTPVDARLPARDFVSRGKALGPRRRRLAAFFPGGRLRWPATALAASAAVVLAVALLPATWRALAPRGPSPDTGGIRSTSVLLVAPVGDVRSPLDFVWRSPVQAASYRVDLLDAGRRSIRSLATTDERAAVTPELRAFLVPGTRYEWTVTALDERGEPLLSSGPAAFRVLPPADPAR